LNILITGATGFIGRHLTAALSKTYPIRCLVRKTSDITFLRDLNVDITVGDLLDKNSLFHTLDGIDIVYHLAGEVNSSRRDDYYKGNVLVTHNLLEACRDRNVKRMIFLSSVGVYKPVITKTLLTEESECEPITFYGKTKLDAEELIKKHKVPWIIVRAPVVYGPHQQAVLNQFFLNAFKKRKIFIIGDGDNLRSLCFIDNLVEGLVLLANKADIDGKTYILSDNSPYTFNEIIETGSKVIKQKIDVFHLPNFFGNISWKIYRLMENTLNLCSTELYAIKKMQLHEGCDITKARKEIGYSPRITLEAGIEITIDWIKKNYNS
jgi:nucleoside-diphosphate-sugar epimerase